MFRLNKSTSATITADRIFSFVQRIARANHYHQTTNDIIATVTNKRTYIIIMYRHHYRVRRHHVDIRAWPACRVRLCVWPWKKKVSPCTQYLCNLITTIRAVCRSAKKTGHQSVVSPIIGASYAYAYRFRTVVKLIDDRWSVFFSFRLLLVRISSSSLGRARIMWSALLRAYREIGFLIKTLPKKYSVVVERSKTFTWVRAYRVRVCVYY